MLRLNTAIAAVPYAQQNRLGIVGNILAGGNDSAGYPNGRRPKDDIVDISLVAVMGGLCVANGDNDALGFGAACKPVGRAAGLDVFKPERQRRPGAAGVPPGLPVPEHALPRRRRGRRARQCTSEEAMKTAALQRLSWLFACAATAAVVSGCGGGGRLPATATALLRRRQRAIRCPPRPSRRRMRSSASRWIRRVTQTPSRLSEALKFDLITTDPPTTRRHRASPLGLTG
jgi:hypothetical protein